LLINADVKGLEVVVAAELSKDETLRREVREGIDFHQSNQDAFGLPSRIVAKRFKFKLLYGATDYGYANDSDFVDVSRDRKFWADVIEKYYTKYRGIAQWHKDLILEAQTTGRLEIPSGRHYPIVPDYTKREPWPLTIIKNYPVQGFGADLVMLARLEARRRLREAAIVCDLISTIHDSIVADTPSENVELVGKILFDSIEAVPALCKKVFDYDFSLPLTSEVQYGMNKKDMKELTFA
jgi:DNA polymerase-1